MKDKDLRYECIKYGNIEVVSKDNHRMDGRRCAKCDGPIVMVGYVVANGLGGRHAK